MLPEGVEAFTAVMGGTIRGEMLVGGLGNCEWRVREPASGPSGGVGEGVGESGRARVWFVVGLGTHAEVEE